MKKTINDYALSWHKVEDGQLAPRPKLDFVNKKISLVGGVVMKNYFKKSRPAGTNPRQN